MTARPWRHDSLYLAWVVSLVATAGSLYFSEVRGFVPCTLCWYQRIAMYPLALLLGIASYHQDHHVVRYTQPLALIGGALSTLHYLQQKFPAFHAPGLCTGGVPCSDQYINWFGFVTIPLLAGIAFVCIAALLWHARPTGGETDCDPHADP